MQKPDADGPESFNAAQFSRMAVAPARIPWSYWNRHVLMELRRSVTAFLGRANVGQGSRVVELGCGNRPYAAVVAARGAKYEGADLPGNKHADLVVDAQGRVPAADGTYDAVLSVQVLEHVASPSAYLAEVRRLLRPGGRLILSTHGIWVYHPSPTDYWRWTAPGLQKVLADNGFRVTAFEGVVGIVPGSLQLFQDHLRKRMPKWLRIPFVAVMQMLITLLDRFHSDAARAREAMIYMLLAEPA